MKTVLVTGASGGIGASICQTLTAEGYRVIGTYWSNQNAVTSMTKLGVVKTWIQVDLSDMQSISNFCKSMRNTPLYGLVNCAGIYEPETTTSVVSTWERVMAINLTAPLLLSTQLADSLKPYGAIVNIGSVWGSIYGGKQAFSYAASKAGLASVTKTLAYMYRDKKIRVNLIAPSAIETNLSISNTQAQLQIFKDNALLNRLGKPEEIASVVSFLLSPKASYITGTTIIVDGGTTC